MLHACTVGVSFHLHTETDHLGNTLAMYNQPATFSSLDAVREKMFQNFHITSKLTIYVYQLQAIQCLHITYRVAQKSHTFFNIISLEMFKVK